MDLYESRMVEMNEKHGDYSAEQANVDWQSILMHQGIDYIKELSYYDKKSIHNLKYFTWVEQQGKNVEELNDQWYSESYWPERFGISKTWDKMIDEFNSKTGLKV
jgi:hypothetical protein